MKKLILILAVLFTLFSCQSPVYMQDPKTDEYLTSDEYYERYPEEQPGYVTIIITIE